MVCKWGFPGTLGGQDCAFPLSCLKPCDVAAALGVCVWGGFCSLLVLRSGGLRPGPPLCSMQDIGCFTVWFWAETMFAEIQSLNPPVWRTAPCGAMADGSPCPLASFGEGQTGSWHAAWGLCDSAASTLAGRGQEPSTGIQACWVPGGAGTGQDFRPNRGRKQLCL